ncbi:hypothetical protein L1887_05204 [Cichorium endivia]|nr:hypothetical protein L1887_05204 [Cichorium endivia]
MGSTHLPVTFSHLKFNTCESSTSADAASDIIQWAGSAPNLRLGILPVLTYKYSCRCVFASYLIARAESSEPHFAF